MLDAGMTTNFALSLSMDGIQLLHRVTGGWKLVGDASIEDPNLDDVLADLRKKAMKLEPSGLRTKLVIPLDQIKYLALDTTQTSQDHIEAAIDGSTPYAMDELVIDCERRGGRTHIAAVAKETLDEAEAFARAHRFNPVCFVAIPEPFTFQSEVFFGPTRMMPEVLGAKGEVARDILPIMIAGTRIKSRLLIFDIPDHELPPTESNDLATLLAPHVQEDTPDAPVVVSEDIPVAAEITDATVTVEQDVSESGVAEAPDLKDVKAAPPVEALVKATQTVAADVMQDLDDAPTVATQELPLFEVAQEETKAPVETQDAVTTTAGEVADPKSKAATLKKRPKVKSDPARLPSFSIPVDPIISEYHTARPKYKRRARRRVVGSLTAVAPAAPSDYPNLETVAPKIAAPAAPARPAPQPQNRQRKRPLLVGTAIAASVVLAAWFAWMQTGGSDDVIEATPDLAATEQQTSMATQLPDIAPNVVFDAPALAQSNPAPLTVSPGLPVLEDWISFAAYNPPPALGLAAPDDLLATPTAMPVPQPEASVAEVGAPVVRGRVLSPDEAALIYEATGVWQRAPRIFEVPGITTNENVVWPAPTVAPDRLAKPIARETQTLEPELDFLAPANPPPPTASFDLDDNGNIIATPDGAVTPEGAVVFAGLPDLNVTARPELSPETLATMQALAPAPDGVEIIAGPPPVVPPLRPDDLGQVTADLPPGAVGVDDLQPTDTDDIITTAALTRPAQEPRPTARPAGLDTTIAPEALPSNPDITSVIAGIATEGTTTPFIDITRNAIAESRRPRARPQNFGRVVTAALQRRPATVATPATPAPQATAAPRAAPAVVSTPRNGGAVPGGVARAATQEDAIQLGDINLIGVYGRANARRALVRLSNGRYVRVEIGSSLDGGQVTAIGDKALNYVKRGRTYAIQVPVN